MNTTRQNVSRRLKIAQGHLNIVIKMVNDKKYCIDIITQCRAVENALKEVSHMLLESHLQTCMVSLVKKGKAQQSIEEIMKVFRNNDK